MNNVVQLIRVSGAVIALSSIGLVSACGSDHTSKTTTVEHTTTVAPDSYSPPSSTTTTTTTHQSN